MDYLPPKSRGLIRFRGYNADGSAYTDTLANVEDGDIVALTRATGYGPGGTTLDGATHVTNLAGGIMQKLGWLQDGTDETEDFLAPGQTIEFAKGDFSDYQSGFAVFSPF